MNTSSNIIVNVLVNTATANAGLSQYTQIMNQITVISRQAAQNSANSFSTIFGAQFFANLASDGSKAFASAFVSGLSDMTQFAARTEELGVALTGLAKVNGINTRSIKEYEQALESANIATQTARQVLTQYIAAGLPLEKSGPLAAVAKDLAVIAGVSSSEELSRLISGITTLQVRVLRTAGVYISLMEAEKNYAKQHGVTLQSLTTEEKQQIALNEVLKFGARAQGLYGLAMETVAKQQRSLERQQQDFADAVGGKLLPVLGLAVTAYSALLNIGTDFPAATIAIAASFGVLAIAVGLTTTSFSALTVSEITNAVATSGLARIIETAMVVMSDFRLVTALTAGEMVLLSGAILGVVGILAAVAIALYTASSAQSKHNALTKEALEQTVARTKAAESEVVFLNSLTPAVSNNAAQQQRLNQIYLELNPTAKARIGFIQDETEKTKALIAEKQRLADISGLQLQAEGTSRVQTLANALRAQQATQDALGQAADLYNNASQIAAQREVTSKNPMPGAAKQMQEDAIRRTAELTTAQGKNADAVKEAALNVAEYNQITGRTTQSTINLAAQTNNLGVETTTLNRAVNSVTLSQDANGKAIGKTTDQIRLQIDALKELTDYEQRGKARNALLQELTTKVAEQYVQQSKPGKYGEVGTQKTPAELLQYQIDHHPELNSIIQDTQRAKAATDAVNKILDPTKVKKTKTEVDTLGTSVKKLQDDVNSFRSASGKAFELRFQKEDLERTKKDLESILNARHELGIPLSNVLPTDAVGARAELEALDRVKNLRDSVLKTNKEVQEGTDKLLVAQLTATSAVVDAQTRADTAYFESIRARRNAEAQLTADITGELRRREQFTTDAARNTAQAQAEAYKEFLTTENDRSSEDLKATAKLAVALGESFKTNPLVLAANNIKDLPKTESPVISRMDKTNDLLGQILVALRVSGSPGADAGIPEGYGLRTSSGRKDLDALYLKYGAQFGVDPNVLLEQGRQESINFSPGVVAGRIRSPKGAGGVAQFMPGTANRFGVDITNPNSSIRGQAQYMRQLLDMFGGNYDLALAGYNAGEGKGKFRSPSDRLNYFLQHVPETAKYVPSILGRVTRSLPRAKFAAPGAVDVAPGTETPTLSTRPRINQASQFVSENFGLDLSQISNQTVNNITAYVDALREFSKYGTNNAVVQDRINQLTNVNIKQKEELAVTESRLNKMLGGDSLSVQEALNAAQIARNTAYTNALTVLAQTNDLLEKIRSGDKNTIGQIITEADAARAQNTAKSYQDIIVARDFLSKFAAGDKGVLENLRANKAASRETQAAGLTTDIFNLQSDAANGGRDAGLERLNTAKAYYSALVDIGQTEAQLDQFRTLRANSTYVQATRTNDVLSEQLDITKKLAAIEDERATSPVNQALRQQLAIETELADIRRADATAGEDAAKAQVRINDATTYHAKQANAAVLEHIASAKSLTEIYADAKIAVVDKVWGATDSLFDKLTKKIPVVGTIIRDLLSNITKLALNQVLLRMLGLTPGAVNGSGSSSPSTGSPSTGGGAISDILRVITGGGNSGGTGTATGGTPPFIGNFASSPAASGGGSGGASSFAGALNAILTLGSANPSGASEGDRAGLGVDISTRPRIVGEDTSTRPRVVGQAAGQGINSVLASLFGKGGLSGLAKNLGSIAPVLGAGIGSSLGGQSILGQILGGGGGLAAGVIGGIATGAINAGGILGGVFGAGGSLAIGGLGAALSATVVLAPIAAALLVGSYFIGKSNERRKQEVQRTQYLTDAKGQLTEILNQVRSGDMDGATAAKQADAIRQQYLDSVNQLTDKKTRNIAVETVRELDSIISSIKTEGAARDRKSAYAAALDNAIVPTFAGGGMFDYVSNNPAMWSRSASDNRVAAFNPSTEAILNRQNIYNLGGYQALANAGVRGADNYGPAQPAARGPNDLPQMTVIVFSDKEKNQLIERTSGKYILKAITPIIYTGQDGGFTDAIESKLAGD